MALYICKCGRQVNKSTNADNTGNRDTAQCTGCPYLLPWGPDKYVEGQGFHKDVQGYECRMSPTLFYTTTYRGQDSDKCTLHILSLDLDFLDTVQAWIDDHAADTLSAGFSRGSMRGTDFSDKGRYSLSIGCAQNKKGMAAKAALIERFFTGGRVRKDMTPVQEKAHILDAIRKGKEQAQRKDTAMKKLNDRCPLQQECERTCKVIGHERDCDYYVNNRYCTEGIPDQDVLLTEEELRQEREREERYLASLSAEPAEPVVYQNEYGTLFAVREHKGAPALMCKPLASDAWTLSGVLAAVQDEAYTAEDLQEVLDEYARAHGWKPVAEPASAEPPEIVDEGSGPEEDCLPQNPTDAAPASRADAGAAEQSPSVAGPASLEAPLSASSAFDYSGLDAQTVQDLHLAEREFAGGKRMAEIGLRRMADGVAIAHDALCGACDKMSQAHNNQHSEKTFGRWCESVGLNRKAAERLLQVSKLFDDSTPREQKVLEELGPSLLYAAAKPSAPAELVRAVKDGDIATNKQYQDLLARYNAERAAREKAEQAREESRKIANTIANQRDEERRRASEAEKQRDGARDALQAAKLRGDKLKAENDALKAHPIEAQVVDEEEINRRAQARADELTAPLREELETLRSRHPADLEEAEQAIRDAYDSAVYTGRVIESAWRSLCPLLPRMDADRRELALNQIVKIISTIQGECIQCL